MNKIVLFIFGIMASLFSLNAEAKKVTVPINIGLGPAAYYFTGALQNAQEQPHLGLQLDLGAVITKKTIKDNEKKIPKKYRKMVARLGEVRISHLLIPDSLFISPALQGTSVYGATWRPIGLNQPLKGKRLKMKFGTGLLLSYAHISREDGQTTNFFRPGLDLRANLDLVLHRRFIISTGWSSGIYLPQTLGGFGISTGPESIWHIGKAYVVLNFRFPFSTRI